MDLTKHTLAAGTYSILKSNNIFEHLISSPCGEAAVEEENRKAATLPCKKQLLALYERSDCA